MKADPLRKAHEAIELILGDLWVRLGSARGSPVVAFAHAVSAAAGGREAAFPGDFLEATLLARCIEWLRERKYVFVSLEDVIGFLNGSALPRRSVHLMFDDGYRCLYKHAYPLLRDEAIRFSVALVEESFRGRRLVWPDELRLRLNANPERIEEVNSLAASTFWVERTTGDRLVYRRNHLKRVPNDERLAFMERLRLICPRIHGDSVRLLEALTEREALEMKDNGVDFLGHTRSHPILSRLERWEDVGREVEPWDARLLRRDALVYPNGKPEDVDSTVFAAMRDAGVEFGFTTVPGPVDRGERLTLRRFPLPHPTGLRVLAYLRASRA
jgi:peptidoglycan/xylan/chitin deacetylase (PgdA/CDA1 family)